MIAIVFAGLWFAFASRVWRNERASNDRFVSVTASVPPADRIRPAGDHRHAKLAAAPLDLALFDAPLWVPPPRPPAPPTPAAPIRPPPPLRLRLMGVELQESRPRAVFFDPDAAAILRAGVGEALATRIGAAPGSHGYVVRSIDSKAVVLESTDRRASHRIELKPSVSLVPGSNVAMKAGDVP